MHHIFRRIRQTVAGTGLPRRARYMPLCFKQAHDAFLF